MTDVMALFVIVTLPDTEIPAGDALDVPRLNLDQLT
jgi:hypothetical protein